MGKKILTLLIAVLITFPLKGQEQSQTMVLENVFIVNPVATDPIKKGTIIIKDGLIDSIHYGLGFKEIPGAQLFNLEGKYIIPGLIDAHVHVAHEGVLKRYGEDLIAFREDVEKVLKKMLVSGVTTVRDLGGHGPTLAHYKKIGTLNKIPTPDIYYSAFLAGPNYFMNLIDGKPLQQKPWQHTITDTTNIAQVVSKAKAFGVTGIKIYNDLSPELVQRIVEEAHQQHLQTWAHAAVFPALPLDVAKSGVNSMSHAYDIFHHIYPEAWNKEKEILNQKQLCEIDTVLKTMKSKNIILDPTNFIASNNSRIIFENGIKITRRAKEMGVKIVTGTDWPYTLEKMPLIEELKILINNCGFSAQEALTSATLTGAQSIGLNDRGAIEKGKRADLVVLSKNPLLDIENLGTPIMVIKKGIVNTPSD